MRESRPYRADLKTFAQSFAVRSRQQLWRDDSLSKAEKMLFVGFFFVRKLIECNKVTGRCAKSSATVSRGAISRSRDVSAFMRDDLLNDINQVQWSDRKVDVHQLADKVIHSWWIIPVGGEQSGLSGFIFTTDKHRNKELWLLPTSSIVEVFERFATSGVKQLHAKRDDIGSLTHWRAE